MSVIVESVIFDLDGVITKTAIVHSAAWKQMFDEYLKYREQKFGEPFVEFSHQTDYIKYVDGKPRYKGVNDFLLSRGINIEYGTPDDKAGFDTVCALGNKKNEKFNEIITKDGVEVYDSTIAFIQDLRKRGIKTGVASSSKNCRPILARMDMLSLFDTCVDGTTSAELNLKGKPEPDIFTTAADNLGCSYNKSIVIEDAVSGVQAGKKGNFGLVIGLARENNLRELEINGADIVVEDITEISFEDIESWFQYGLKIDGWNLTYKDYNKNVEKTRETLMTVGNGYFGTRGNMSECFAGENNYPGTYMAGVYNRLRSKVGDKMITNEDFVNCPNWTVFRFKIGREPWIDINECEIKYIERNLDLRSGELQRVMCLKDKKGRIHLIDSRRFASMSNYHVAGEKYSFTAINYSGTATFCIGINGDIINAGVDRYKQLNQKHLNPDAVVIEDNVITVGVETTQSKITVVEMAKITSDIDKTAEIIKNRSGYIEYSAKVKPLTSVDFQKIVTLYNSYQDKGDVYKKSAALINSIHSYDALLRSSRMAWKKIWDEIDIEISGDRLAQKLIRLHLYHLMVSFSPHNENFDASITARGLHGEAYRGHIFWDELYILPFYCLHYPEAAKAMLMYRYRRLDEARKYARANGYKGAMFPWQSGSSGREETQTLHLNPVSGQWGDDYSCLQRHVSLAVGYDIYMYYHTTGDIDFMSSKGYEMISEICRFWVSMCKYDPETRRYSIEGVMGPDEFHEKYPESDKGGLRDNAYTNVMTAWLLNIGANLFDDLSEYEDAKKIIGKLKLTNNEIEHWRDIATCLRFVIENDIIAQYDGYFELKDLDWEKYREKYGNIYRMDRILKAEGLSPDNFKVAKQADTLMMFYTLPKNDVSSLLKSMGYKMSNDYIQKNLRYYLARTSHGSTLSKIVHAQLANMIDDFDLSRTLYFDALTSDFIDVQGGTTAEGIHAGVMCGTILIALFSFAGINIFGEQIELDVPKMPKPWTGIKSSLTFRGKRFKADIH